MLLTQSMLLMSSCTVLDMRHRFKAVMDVLGAMIRHGVSLSRSVELTGQWDGILAVGPVYPVTLDDLQAVDGSGLGGFSSCCLRCSSPAQ